MVNSHPHLGATYQLLFLNDGTFGVIVTIPDMQPITVTDFGTETLANKWIERHKEAIAAGNSLRVRQFVRKA